MKSWHLQETSRGCGQILAIFSCSYPLITRPRPPGRFALHRSCKRCAFKDPQAPKRPAGLPVSGHSDTEPPPGELGLWLPEIVRDITRHSFLGDLDLLQGVSLRLAVCFQNLSELFLQGFAMLHQPDTSTQLTLPVVSPQ